MKHFGTHLDQSDDEFNDWVVDEDTSSNLENGTLKNDNFAIRHKKEELYFIYFIGFISFLSIVTILYRILQLI